uniref:Lon proteolytic domain-containing protein n=1 Tax=Globodera rostochiensis TaxID=31243 RepID=A0A914HTW8_GLORO
MSSQQSEGRVKRKRPQTRADAGGLQGIRNRTDTLATSGSKVKKISTDAQLRHRKLSTCSPTVSPNPSSIANTAQNPCPLQTDRMNTSATTTTNTVESTTPTTSPCSNPNNLNSSSICSSTTTTSSSMAAALSASEKPSKLGRATEPGGGGGSPARKQPHLATTTTVSEPDQHQQQPVRKNLIQKLIEIDRLSDLINLRGLRIRSTEASAAERLSHIEFVSPDYLGADLEHVEVMQRKFDEFLKELKSHESRVLDINREANTLTNEGHPEQQQIRQKRDEVNEEWHKLGEIEVRADSKQTTETGQRLLGMLVPPPICTRYNWPKSVLLPGICPGISRTTEDEGSVIYIEVANNFLNQAGSIVHLGQWDGMAIDAMMKAHTMVKNWLLQEDPSNKKLLKTALSMNIVGPVHLHAGPSAALPMALAIASWATNRRVRNRRVFTGQVSLVKGWITAVGGIAQKTAAARACGYSRLSSHSAGFGPSCAIWTSPPANCPEGILQGNNGTLGMVEYSIVQADKFLRRQQPSNPLRIQFVRAFSDGNKSATHFCHTLSALPTVQRL